MSTKATAQMEQRISPTSIPALSRTQQDATLAWDAGASPAAPGFGHDYAQVTVQAKLTLNAPGDKYEQEADRIADQVMRMPEPRLPDLQRTCLDCDERLQRQVEPEEEDEEEKAILQTKALAGHDSATAQRHAQPGVESRIQQARGSGEPLAGRVRDPMERALGVDFSQVRIHADAEADRLSRSLQARAFTKGRDIFFRSGEYALDSSSGRGLLAHELTHVVQQGRATIQRCLGTVQNEEGGRRAQPTPDVTIAGETERHPAEEEEMPLSPAEVEGSERPPDVQRDGEEPATPARPSLTLTPGPTLTRGSSLAAAVSFTPAAGERIDVTGWEYTTPGHGAVTRAATDADFQTRWAGTMALSGTLRMQWHYQAPNAAVETLEQPVTVNDRSGAPWASTVTDNAETARAGMPSPPRQFSDLGIHNANVTDASPTSSTISDGPNHDFTYVSALTAGRYTSSPQIHPDVTDASSALRVFHRDGSVLFKVPVAGGAKTRIPVGEYSNFVEDPLSWDVPDWEAFYKRHGIYTVQATAGSTTRTVADANWRLDSNAQDADLVISNDAAVRTQLGIGPDVDYSWAVVTNYTWEGYALMPGADIPGGVRSHEFAHATHSHRANFHKMVRALDPQKLVERTVSSPSNTVDFATRLSDLRTEILAPNHEIVDEAESARQERFVAVPGATMAGVNTNPDTGAFLGNVWDITGNAPMT